LKGMVIYDSFFGNTEQIAKAIGKVLQSKGNVKVLKVNQVKPEQLVGLNLLIVGSPTRAFRPTGSINRFLGKIPRNGLKDIKVAAFDTGISLDDVNSTIGQWFIKSFGYAAKPISDKLKKKRGELIAPPEGFFVEGTEGPLKQGELERAADWAKRILVT
jgi:flavodoxin I